MSDTPYKPLEGDPDLLATKARHYANIADAISRSVTTLHKIHDVDDMKSKSTEELKDSSDKVADDIGKAHERYSTTAAALLTYSGKLREAQDAANTAIAHINAKQSAADAANHAATKASTTAESSKGDDKTKDQKAATQAQDAATTANQELQAAQKEWHDALDRKNAAAKIAKDAIDYVVNGKGNHGLKDVHHWYDGIVHFATAAFGLFKKLCDLAGVLAVFLAWVPGLGEVLLAMAAIGAVLDFIAAGVALFHGGSWTDFLIAGAGVALTIFGGKMIELGAKGMKGVMVTRAAKALEEQGADVDRGLRALQGVGAHSSEEYMTAEKAMAAKTELKDAFSSVSKFKGATLKAFKESFTHDGTFTDALKDAFTPSGLSNSDLVSMVKMGIKDPSLIDSKLVLSGLGVAGLKVGQDAVDIHDQYEDEDRPGFVPPGMGEGYAGVNSIVNMVTP